MIQSELKRQVACRLGAAGSTLLGSATPAPLGPPINPTAALRRQIFPWVAAVILFLVLAPSLQAQPDCVIFFSFATTGNSINFDNRTRGCQDWTVAYTAQGFATLSLITQSAPDAGATPGAWVTFAGTVVNGINPNTSVAQATTRFSDYYPWMRVRLDAITGGPGTVVGVLYGWKIPPSTLVSVSGTVTVAGTVTSQNQLFNGDTGTWFNEYGCTESAPFDITAGTTQIVALAAGQQIRVCKIIASWDATVDLSYIYGTGANCAVGTTALTGTIQSITAIADDLKNSQSALIVPASNALCLVQTGAANGGGYVVYARY